MISLIILINSYIKPNEVPNFFGWKPFIVLSNSMEPFLQSGDLVVTKRIDANHLKANDIISFKTSDDIIVTHRIIDITTDREEKHFITKGDNNNTNDSGYVLSEQIEGIYQLRIPKLGHFAIFIQTPLGIIICSSIPIAIFMTVETIEHKKKEQTLKKEIIELKKGVEVNERK